MANVFTNITATNAYVSTAPITPASARSQHDPPLHRLAELPD